MKVLRNFGIVLLTLLAWSGIAGAQAFTAGKWQSLKNAPSFSADTPLLLTNGTVMVHQYQSVKWWQLTPDITGNYVNGTWTELASAPTGYEPLYFASAVLADGNVVVEGGEYNGDQTETTEGAIYNPFTNTWTSISPPTGWTAIGDAQSVVLADDTFMLGNCGFTGTICSSLSDPFQFQQALLTESSLTWTITGTGKADQNSEEGWALLPNGEVMVVDMDNGTESELYDPSTGSWSLAGSTVAPLVETTCYEIGPMVLQPNGILFAIGGNNNTALYNTNTSTW